MFSVLLPVSNLLSILSQLKKQARVIDIQEKINKTLSVKGELETRRSNVKIKTMCW